MEAKTPVLEDKRFFISVGTILSLLIAKFFKVELSPELLASIVTVVVGYITNSALKEAKVAQALAEAAKAGQAAAVDAKPAPAKDVDALVNG